VDVDVVENNVGHRHFGQADDIAGNLRVFTSDVEGNVVVADSKI